MDIVATCYAMIPRVCIFRPEVCQCWSLSMLRSGARMFYLSPDPS